MDFIRVAQELVNLRMCSILYLITFLGPTIIDSELSFTGDDLMNIHNEMLIVWEKLSDTELIILEPLSPSKILAHVSPSDALQFFSLPDMGLIGGFSISAITQIHNKTMIEEAKNITGIMQQKGYHIKEVYTVSLFQVTFSKALDSVNAFDLGHSDIRSGAYAHVENTYFHDGYVTGMKLKVGKQLLHH